MTQDEQEHNLAAVIAYLLENGWAVDGTSQSVEVPVGLEGVVRLGGRRRFAKADWKVTVGLYTVTFYQIGPVEYPKRGPHGSVYWVPGLGAVNRTNFDTKRLDRIKRHAEKLS